MKILIVDDHPKIRESLKKFFHLERIESEEARTGQEALDKIRSSCYDLCILDMNMPIMSGREFLKIIRQERIPLKVLVLTADSRTEDTVEALNLGADDYLRKPFSFDELLARVRALTRRHEQVTLEIEEYGPYLIDLGNRHISENHIEIPLTHKQWLLFETLFRRRWEPQSKTVLLSEVWGENADNLDLSTQTLEAHIYSLRQKLSPKMIVTLRNIGYIIPHLPPF